MWDYTEKVMDHFLHPRNVGEIEKADAVGEVGNISCGDALTLYLKVDENEKIIDAKFKTFGCASAIASSSALTEIVMGKTLDEASKITNKDIVKVLGDLPEEKLHCSVMGMEALEAAIADYRGEAIPGQDHEGDHEGRIVCKCFGVTDTKIKRVAKENDIHTVEGVTNYCKAGGACGTCLDQIQEILDGLWRRSASDSQQEAKPESDFDSLPIIKKAIKVQEVIDKEIRPILEKDGGSIELVDIRGSIVQVRLKGRCSTCPTAHVTLKHTVEDKIREFVSPSLKVESV